jgi:GMP synthase (glutamine-hydrolysing)
MILVVNNGSRYMRTLLVRLREYRIKFRVSDFYNTLPKFSRYKGIILSGGSNFVSERFEFIKDIIKKTNIPVLGICLGNEYIARTFGGETIHDVPENEEFYDINVIKENELTGNAKILKDMDCHMHKITKLPTMFEVLGASMYSRYDIIKHKQKPIYGVQFHPENNEVGKKILGNFLKNICHEIE